MDIPNLPYRSIACGTYDLFEAAALRHHRVMLKMIDGAAVTGQIADVFSRGNEEFCRFFPEDQTVPVEFRLDTVAEITDLHDGTRLSTGTC
ncbi:MAG: hypothetical protein MUE68_00535 [Bacteroidetes bacterium]|jgi:transcriptional antiterminator Rof (Rho-off)|nr:hypothetical protein [Bacteroidota bacterium]